MSLFSHLLKRLIISRTSPLPWSQCTPTRDERTKPVFYTSGRQPLKFNVSHQAGLVVLYAVTDPDDVTDDIGVDIVCPGERRGRDHETIAKEGWAHYVEIHDSVFSVADTTRLKGIEGDVDRKLRYFYALWCLREAYVKMTGDALLASWLGELEVRYFSPPGEPSVEGDKDLEIWMGREEVKGVKVQLEWALEEFMLGTVRRGGEDGVGWEELRLEDVLDEAERARDR